MAFNVRYDIIAVDKFTNISKKVNKSLKETAAKFKKATKETEKFGKMNKFTGGKIRLTGNEALIAAKKVDKLGNESMAAGMKTRAATGMMAGSFRRLGSSILAMAGAGSAALLTIKMLRTGMDFETQMADLSAITGATGEQLNFMANESLRLSKVGHATAQEVSEGFKLIASAKDELLKNPEALAHVTEQALVLKNAAGIDMNLAAKSLSTSLNQFSADADQASRFVNVMAASAKFGAAEIEDISESLKKAGPAAAIAGVSFEETNAMIQKLAKGGIKGSIAGRGLNAVILRMMKIGVDFKKESVGDAFLRVKSALEQITDPAKRARVIMKTFGVENVKTAETLLLHASDLDNLTRKVTGTSIAIQQAAINNATFSKTWQRLGASVNEKFIRIYDKVKPKLTEVAEAMIAFVDSITEEDMNRIADGFRVIADSLMAIGTAGKVAISAFKGTGTFLAAYAFRAKQRKELFEEKGYFASQGSPELAAIEAQYKKNLEGLFESDGQFLGIIGESKTAKEYQAKKIADQAKLKRLQEEQNLREMQDETLVLPTDKTLPPTARAEKDVIEMNINVKGNTESVQSVETTSDGRKIKPKVSLEN